MDIVAMAKVDNKIETCKKNGENFEKKLWQGMKRNEFLANSFRINIASHMSQPT